MNDIWTRIVTSLNQIDWEPIVRPGIKIVLILITYLILGRLIKSFLNRLEKSLVKKGIVEGEPPSESQKRVETITRLLRQAIRLALGIVVFMMILVQLGVEVGPLIASAGILGVALGFGSQNLVRDVISGFFIIMENQIRVGDVAVVNGTGGLVEQIRFRTTVLRDLSGVVHIFPNGTITTLSNVTNEWSAYVFDIGVAYKEDTDQVVSILKDIGHDMKESEEFGRLMLEEPEVFGVDKFADSAVMIKGRIKTMPIRQWAVGREFLRRVKKAFDEQGIEIPFPHRTLYMGEAGKPFDIQVLDRLTNRNNDT